MGCVCRRSSSCTPTLGSCCTLALSLRWRCARLRSRCLLSRLPSLGAVRSEHLRCRTARRVALYIAGLPEPPLVGVRGVRGLCVGLRAVDAVGELGDALGLSIVSLRVRRSVGDCGLCVGDCGLCVVYTSVAPLLGGDIRRLRLFCFEKKERGRRTVGPSIQISNRIILLPAATPSAGGILTHHPRLSPNLPCPPTRTRALPASRAHPWARCPAHLHACPTQPPACTTDAPRVHSSMQAHTHHLLSFHDHVFPTGVWGTTAAVLPPAALPFRPAAAPT